MTKEDDPLAEIRQLMYAAVYGHQYDSVLEHFHDVFDDLADSLALCNTVRIVICLTKAYHIAKDQGDQQTVDALEAMLKPILPDPEDKL